jgi:hypothetical protein
LVFFFNAGNVDNDAGNVDDPGNVDDAGNVDVDVDSPALLEDSTRPFNRHCAFVHFYMRF